MDGRTPAVIDLAFLVVLVVIFLDVGLGYEATRELNTTASAAAATTTTTTDATPLLLPRW